MNSGGNGKASHEGRPHTRFRRTMAVATGTALALPLAGVAIAVAAPSPGQSAADGSTQVIHLLSTNAVNTDLDLGKPGLSAGDQQVFVDQLYRDGKQVGRSAGAAQIVAATPRTITVQLLTNFILPDGSITGQGAFTESLAVGPKPFKLAITGGTGAYRTARGEATLAILPNSNDSRITLHLVR